MLLRGRAGQRLEHVGVVGGAVLQRPLLHRLGDRVGELGVERLAALERRLQLLEDVAGQPFALHGDGEDVGAERVRSRAGSGRARRGPPRWSSTALRSRSAGGYESSLGQSLTCRAPESRARSISGLTPLSKSQKQPNGSGAFDAFVPAVQRWLGALVPSVALAARRAQPRGAGNWSGGVRARPGRARSGSRVRRSRARSGPSRRSARRRRAAGTPPRCRSRRTSQPKFIPKKPVRKVSGRKIVATTVSQYIVSFIRRSISFAIESAAASIPSISRLSCS